MHSNALSSVRISDLARGRGVSQSARRNQMQRETTRFHLILILSLCWSDPGSKSILAEAMVASIVDIATLKKDTFMLWMKRVAAKKKRMMHHPRQSTAQYCRLSIGMQPEPLHRKALTALVKKFDMVGQRTI